MKSPKRKPKAPGLLKRCRGKARLRAVWEWKLGPQGRGYWLAQVVGLSKKGEMLYARHLKRCQWVKRLEQGLPPFAASPDAQAARRKGKR